MKVLVANPPWPGPGYGARSDVRWPHKRSDKYIEYPIYLSYTVAVLEEAGFDVSFIDAIMDELSIEAFAQQGAATGARAWPSSRPRRPASSSTWRRRRPSSAIAPRPSWRCSAPTSPISTRRSWPRTRPWTPSSAASSSTPPPTWPAPWTTGCDLGERDWASPTATPKAIRAATQTAPSLSRWTRCPSPPATSSRAVSYRAGIYSGGKPTAMVSSRGCPYRCTFCLWPDILYGHKFRARSAENVVDEIEEAVRTYGHDEIYFDDDTFTIDRQRVMDICRLIRERGLEKEVEWIAQCRVDTVDREMLEAMKAANCGYILFGVESGSPQMLKKMKKGITLDKVRARLQADQGGGHQDPGLFPLWHAGRDARRRSARPSSLPRRLNASSTQFAVAIPHPGTALYEECKTNGWLTSEDWADYTAEISLIETPWLTAQEVEQARIRAYREYYYRPRYIVGEALKVRRLADLKRLARGANSVRGRIRFFTQATADLPEGRQ